MPARIQQARGDVFLGNQQGLPIGHLFYSYINENPSTSKGHSYSEGQLWVVDPSNPSALTEIASKRKLKAAVYRGTISEDFKGDFIHADENTQSSFRHCKPGDFWIFDSYALSKTESSKITDTNDENYKYKSDFLYHFAKGDILLITEAVYETEGSNFRHDLTSVQYIKIPGAAVDKDRSDLEAQSAGEAVVELEQRLLYKGECNSLQSFYNLPKKKGWMYFIRKPFVAPKNSYSSSGCSYEGYENRDTASGKSIQLKLGDFIFWNGESWVVIASGGAESLQYDPDSDAIDAIETFEDFHKNQLKEVTNVKEALDVLFTQKAGLDQNGKVPWSQLPTALKSSLTLCGKFYPVNNLGKNKDDPNNQNPWPSPIDVDGVLQDTWDTGWFYIVDCQGFTNVQYKDKLQSNRIVELNSGDWIVWVKSTNQFEVIDNSDRISAIEVKVNNVGEDRVTLVGKVGLASDGLVELRVDGDTIYIGGDLTVTKDGKGRKNYFPIYSDDATSIIPSELHQEGDTIISDIGFEVGSVLNNETFKSFGDVVVHKTVGSSVTGYINHSFTFVNDFSPDASTVINRTTKIWASTRNTFTDGSEDLIDLYLPEKSGILVGVQKDDGVTPGYHTKTNVEGFITDSLTSERIEAHNDFIDDEEDGFENVGIGRTTSEDLDTGEITFYAKTKDNYRGFYTSFHRFENNDSQQFNLREHYLDRAAISKTHLIINPSVLENEVETFVKMPSISGTLITWEDMIAIFGSPGVPLMIPAWEKQHFDVWDYVGLDTSPITIKLNRKKHGRTSVDRYNNLGENYGKGTKSTWSYIGSSKVGSLPEKERGSVDDVVSFDAWLEAQRSVATNEAFILPSTSKVDGSSKISVETLKQVREVDDEPDNDKYGRDKSGGTYQRIVPSRTLYPDSPQYYDPITGELIKQQTTDKDVEMPAVGGVLLTDRSTIYGGYWF